MSSSDSDFDDCYLDSLYPPSASDSQEYHENQPVSDTEPFPMDFMGFVNLDSSESSENEDFDITPTPSSATKPKPKPDQSLGYEIPATTLLGLGDLDIDFEETFENPSQAPFENPTSLESYNHGLRFFDFSSDFSNPEESDYEVPAAELLGLGDLDVISDNQETPLIVLRDHFIPEEEEEHSSDYGFDLFGDYSDHNSGDNFSDTPFHTINQLQQQEDSSEFDGFDLFGDYSDHNSGDNHSDTLNLINQLEEEDSSEFDGFDLFGDYSDHNSGDNHSDTLNLINQLEEEDSSSENGGFGLFDASSSEVSSDADQHIFNPPPNPPPELPTFANESMHSPSISSAHSRLKKQKKEK